MAHCPECGRFRRKKQPETQGHEIASNLTYGEGGGCRSQEDRSKLRDEIVGYCGELKELQWQHEATICEREKAYKQQQRVVLKELCHDLVTIFGPPSVQKAVHDISSTNPTKRQDKCSRVIRQDTQQVEQSPTPLDAEDRSNNPSSTVNVSSMLCAELTPLLTCVAQANARQ